MLLSSPIFRHIPSFLFKPVLGYRNDLHYNTQKMEQPCTKRSNLDNRGFFKSAKLKKNVYVKRSSIFTISRMGYCLNRDNASIMHNTSRDGSESEWTDQ